MPGFDGTGPLGKGAGTGRLLGRCFRRSDGVGQTTSRQGTSRGLGLGRVQAGAGLGQGLRQGFCRWFGKGR